MFLSFLAPTIMQKHTWKSVTDVSSFQNILKKMPPPPPPGDIVEM